MKHPRKDETVWKEKDRFRSTTAALYSTSEYFINKKRKIYLKTFFIFIYFQRLTGQLETGVAVNLWPSLIQIQDQEWPPQLPLCLVDGVSRQGTCLVSSSPPGHVFPHTCLNVQTNLDLHTRGCVPSDVVMIASLDLGRVGHLVHVTVGHVELVHVSEGWSYLLVKAEHIVLHESSGDNVGQEDAVRN